MSRVLMIGVLAILLGLLAVMANLVNPKKEPPKPQDVAAQAKAQEAMQTQQEAMMKKERDQRQNEWKKQQDAIQKKEQASGLQTNLSKRRPGLSQPPTAPNPTAMDITHDWFTKRKDGAEGLQELSAEQKRLEEAAKKYRESQKPMQPGDPTATPK